MKAKTKIITIENWDGSKYDVKAPANAKYLGILSHTGDFMFYRKKPELSSSGYYDANPGDLIDEDLYSKCPRPDNYPCEDGYGSGGTVIINGIHASELLLRIREA